MMNMLEDVILIRKKLEKESISGDVNLSRVEELLVALEGMQMTSEVLKQSKIALVLNLYRKNFKDNKVGLLARELRESWMKMWDVNKEKLKNSSKRKSPTGVKSNVTSEDEKAEPRDDANEWLITVLKDLMCLTQRARFNVTITTDHLELVGKSTNYKILYSSIQHLLLLPDENCDHYYFVIELDTPLKRGKTEYKLFVFTLSSKTPLRVELLMNQTELDRRYDGTLKKFMNGSEHEMISAIVSIVANKKLISTDSSKGSTKNNSISCSFKSDAGLLYPLKKSFAFLPKPSLHIKFEDIKSVSFDRSDGYNRTFDFGVNLLSKKSYHFSIEKEKFDFLQCFLRQKNLLM